MWRNVLGMVGWPGGWLAEVYDGGASGFRMAGGNMAHVYVAARAEMGGAAGQQTWVEAIEMIKALKAGADLAQAFWE